MKKRTIKLFSVCGCNIRNDASAREWPIKGKSKGFLVLFFKKELLLPVMCASVCLVCNVVVAAQGAKPAPAKVEQVRKAGAESLLGQSVTDAKGDVFGNVVDVLIDADGTPHAAVVQFTGFFGIGSRQVAVDWKALKFAVQGDHIAIRVSLDPDTLKAMPEYKTESQSVPVATQAAPAHAKPN